MVSCCAAVDPEKTARRSAWSKPAWLSALPYLAATIAMLAASWASDKLNARKAFVWPFLLIGAVAFAASYALGSTHFWMSYALLVIAGAAMYAPYGPFFAIVPETAAEERRWWRDGADQQHGRARLVRGLLCGRLSERRDPERPRHRMRS